MEWTTVQHLDLRHVGRGLKPLQPHAAAFHSHQALVAVAIGSYIIGKNSAIFSQLLQSSVSIFSRIVSGSLFYSRFSCILRSEFEFDRTPVAPTKLKSPKESKKSPKQKPQTMCFEIILIKERLNGQKKSKIAVWDLFFLNFRLDPGLSVVASMLLQLEMVTQDKNVIEKFTVGKTRFLFSTGDGVKNKSATSITHSCSVYRTTGNFLPQISYDDQPKVIARSSLLIIAEPALHTSTFLNDQHGYLRNFEHLGSHMG